MPWALFALMWVAFAWMSVSSAADPPAHLPFQIQVPVFEQNCSSKTVACIDDCSFLCVEPKARCIGGVCRVDPKDDALACNTDKGGMLMLRADPVATWMCLCTHESIWSGPACDTLNPDVCENGVFMYKNRDNAVCVCPFPYKKTLVNGKWHCLDVPLSHFFEESYGMFQERIGPSRRRRH